MNEATRKLAAAREKFNYHFGMSDITDARDAIDVLFDVVGDLVHDSQARAAATQSPVSLRKAAARFWRTMNLQQKTVDGEIQLRDTNSTSEFATIVIPLDDDEAYNAKVADPLAKLLGQLPRIMDFVETVAAGNTEINDLEVTAANLIAEFSV